MRRAAVVGAGLGGLAAAARLAHAGVSVDLFDSQAFAGGKAGSLELGGCRFDTGPSLFTMPELFASVFASFGRRMEDYFTPVRLDPLCAYWWPDGTRLSSRADSGDFGRAAAEAFGEAPAAVSCYFERARCLWEVAGELFLERPIHESAIIRDRGFWGKLLRLPAVDPLRSLHARNERSFGDPRLVQLFDRYATYNGSSPFRTPATMAVIPYAEHRWGGWTVREGIAAIPRALEAVCREEGVRFHLGVRAERILLDGRRVRGVEVRGPGGAERCSADVVVADVDPRPVYRELLGAPDHPACRRYERLEPSSSGFVFFWAMRRGDPRLLVNNIFFSADYAREFAELFGARRLPGDPTVYVNITAKETPGDAPEGWENWFVLVNSPPDAGQDWTADGEALRGRVLARLSAALGRDVERDIAAEARLSPADIAARTGSPGGSLYGIASNSPGAAFRRHRNRSVDFPGLYFCGGSSHPGGGMPLVLSSGRMAAELALSRELAP